MKHFSLLLFAGILLTACEGETTWIKQIDNRSNFDVTVSFKQLPEGSAVSERIPAHSSEVILYHSKRGGDESPQPCLALFENLQIELDSGVVLLKDIHEEGNWDYSDSQKTWGGVVNQTCRFVIDNNDFSQ